MAIIKETEITEGIEVADNEQELADSERSAGVAVARHRYLSLHDRAAVCFARKINSRG